MTILAATNTENNRTGSGAYKPLKRSKKENNNENEQNKEDFLSQKDRRMRFKNAKDPVYVAFDYLDRQPLRKLAIDFVRDSLTEIIYFISKPSM